MFGVPAVPARGAIAQVADGAALIVSVVLLILLIFFVVDTTLLCERFVRQIGANYRRWPADEHSPHGAGRDHSSYRAWKTSQLIARCTEAVTPLIWYPFLVLLLMILSRVSFFDRWGWPPSIVIVFAINSVFAIGCALLLRHSAEEARTLFLREMHRDQVRLSDQRDEKRMELCIADVERERRGAFAPLSHQPVLRALLLPFGGVGAAVFLESLTGSM